MLTIKRHDGVNMNLSDEVYELVDDVRLFNKPDKNYRKGTQVRLIGGVDASPVPGYHFVREMVTICRIDATEAEFRGVPCTLLKLVASEVNVT